MPVNSFLHRLVVRRRGRQNAVNAAKVRILYSIYEPRGAVVAYSQQYRNTPVYGLYHSTLYFVAFFRSKTRGLACCTERADKACPVIDLVVYKVRKRRVIN